jgi:hypothetical protein
MLELNWKTGDDNMETIDWYAWITPSKPEELHITGLVEVSNPGVQVLLVETVPQGINPRILILNLYLIQQAGCWPQVLTFKQASYIKTLNPNVLKYTSFEIRYLTTNSEGVVENAVISRGDIDQIS